MRDRVAHRSTTTRVPARDTALADSQRDTTVGPPRSTGDGQFTPPVPAGRSRRILLVGTWSTAHVTALGSLFTVVDAATAAACGRPVDWLLAAAGPGTPMALRNLVRGLRTSSSPHLRVAVVDPGYRWPAGGDGDLVATLWLAGRGFSVSRFTASARNRRELPSALTDRETDLLQALCAGLGNDQIARELNISRSTVEFHLTRIFKKLEVTSRAEAIVRVLQHGVPV
jgi:DNA-binding CsgD family transcriptional regulator